MSIPELLISALTSLPEDPRFEIVEGWVGRGNGLWSFKFRARLSVPASEQMPEWSAWHLVAASKDASPDIHVYPDAGGISAQFQHQALNLAAVDGAAWRTGSPCLERPISSFKRDGWSGEPSELGPRLEWYIGRLFVWIDAAAEGRLVDEGDPIELPVIPLSIPNATLGFWEEKDGLAWWSEIGESWGFATLADIPGSIGTMAVADFLDPQRRSIRRPHWGPGVPQHPGRVDAVWMVMPKLVVGTPWRLPATWHEFADYCAEASIDLPNLLAEAGAKLRHIERPKVSPPRILLVGFPMGETYGEPAERVHWLAFGNLRTARRSDVRNGFSDRAVARRDWDKGLATEKRPIAYIATGNWAPDQLRRRGEAEADVRSKSILILGGGALGGAVAENLVRMGVARVGIVDADRLTIGNLSRHVLTMRNLGSLKAKALATELNGTMPDANVVAFEFSFPPTKAEERSELEGWDVIVDCTAEDAVLHAMAAYPWDGVKVFVSLSMTWRARGLFAYADEQASFPALDAIERFIACSEKPDEDTIGMMEGIGCWHPVFPATADDVQLWAAIGSKFVRRAVCERQRMCEHFLQDDFGSVERNAA